MRVGLGCGMGGNQKLVGRVWVARARPCVGGALVRARR